MGGKRTTRFIQADVFTSSAFRGNPVAVFPTAHELSSEEMQQIAREMNLSETAFVLPPANPRVAAYRVRFFTPRAELPFAGHPTLGVAYVLAQEGLIALTGAVTHVLQETSHGMIPVEIHHDGHRITMVAMGQGRPRFLREIRAAHDLYGLADALSVPRTQIGEPRLPVEIVSTGLPVMLVPIKSLSTIENLGVKAMRVSELCERHGAQGVMAFTRMTVHEESTVHTRMFAPLIGVTEDPATGSASGALGAYLVRHGVVTADPTARLICEQGYELNRPGTIHIEVVAEQQEITDVRVGGEVIRVLEGVLTL